MCHLIRRFLIISLVLFISGGSFYVSSQGTKLEADVKKANRRLESLRFSQARIKNLLKSSQARRVERINANWDGFVAKLDRNVKELKSLDRNLEKSFKSLSKKSTTTKGKRNVWGELERMEKDESYFESTYKLVKSGNESIGDILRDIRYQRDEACGTSDSKKARAAFVEARDRYDEIRPIYQPMATAWLDMKSRMAYFAEREKWMDGVCDSWTSEVDSFYKTRKRLLDEIDSSARGMFYEPTGLGSRKTADFLTHLRDEVADAELLYREIRILTRAHPTSTQMQSLGAEASTLIEDIRMESRSFGGKLPSDYDDVKSDVDSIPRDAKILDKSKYRKPYLMAARYRNRWSSLGMLRDLTRIQGKQSYDRIQDAKKLMSEIRECARALLEDEEERRTGRGNFYISRLVYNPRTINNGPRNDLTVYFMGNFSWPVTVRMVATKCPPGVSCPPVSKTFDASSVRNYNAVTLQSVLYCTNFTRSDSVYVNVTATDAEGRQTAPKRLVTNCIVR